VGPFEVKEDRVKGFYLVATDYIEPGTIVSEYSGEVMKSREALNYEDNDSIFMLVRGSRCKDSIDIVPEKYSNIARFFSGINNTLKRAQFAKLENIKSLRFSYGNRTHLLLYAIKPIQASETLYFDYNGSAFHEYPT
jgi:[histone H3]-lysine27 N-methyltransferase